MPLAAILQPSIIYAVIVLYNQSPAASPAVSALLAHLSSESVLHSRFRVLLYDNSLLPQQAALPDFDGLTYHHDATNPGLAAAYNAALKRAVEHGAEWLLLLDQDTLVTPAYIEEALLLTQSLEGDARIAAIVPKLISAKGIKSPTLDFLEWLRRQLQFPRKRPLFATPDMYGPQQEQFSAFNSASILRVTALRNIGGFPPDFWLDFLDVAVFHALHERGGRIFIMRSVLEHELSMDTAAFYEKASALARHQNLLAAMIHFVRTRGTPRDLWLTRIWLLRNALTLLRSTRDKRFSLASLRQAFRLDPARPRPHN